MEPIIGHVNITNTNQQIINKLAFAKHCPPVMLECYNKDSKHIHLTYTLLIRMKKYLHDLKTQNIHVVIKGIKTAKRTTRIGVQINKHRSKAPIYHLRQYPNLVYIPFSTCELYKQNTIKSYCRLKHQRFLKWKTYAKNQIII